MAGTLKVDSINADSNLALKIANTAVAFIDSNGLRPTSGNVSLDATGTSKFYLPSANTVAIQTAGTTAVTVDSSQNVGIGTTSPTNRLTVNGGNGTTPTIRLNGGTAADDNALISSKYNLVLGCNADGNIASRSITFVNSTTENMRIDSSGNVLVTSAAGLGYGTGSGGTVTQATSKSTAVTLNKPTGQVTTNSAALASGATVAFSINNSIISITDVVVVVVSSGSSYTVQPQFVGAGVASIRLTNITGGSLSEAVVINFAVIKGATS